MFKKIVVLTIITFLLISCNNETDIKIGFAGSLTGSGHEMGTAAHNGFQMAVEEINKAGGINGKMIITFIKDDQTDLDRATIMIDEFIDDDVQYIIGFLTSNMTPAVELGLSKNLFFVSPSISTPLLSEKDDYFIRTVNPMEFEARELARYTYDLGVRKLSIVYDMSNDIFAKKYYEILSQEFLLRETEIVFIKALYDLDYDTITEKIIDSNTDGLCLITSANSASEILQRLHKSDFRIPIGLSQWTMVSELIEKGGKSVEGAYGLSFYNQYGETERFNKFREKYYTRFNTEPSFISITTYESVMVLKDAFEKSISPSKVKDYIVDKTYDGLQDEFTINKYGDGIRNFFTIRIEDGVFTLVE
jgi:branched-chain amino acid transport system substrate-binding protein